MDEQAPVAVEREYRFRTVAACNMCGAPAADFKILGMRLNRSQGRDPRGKIGIAVSVCRCQRCSLVFTSPQPVPRSIADHYDLPPESYWREVRFDPEPGYFAEQTTTAKRLLDFCPGMKAIDVGLGLGKTVRVLRDAGFDVYGLEPSEPFYKKAVEFLGEEDHFLLSSVEDAEFEPGVFDFVTFGAVLEHIYDPSSAIEKALRWLKPGGIIQAEVPNSKHLVAAMINGYFRLLGTSYVTNTSPMHVPFHLFEFTVDSFAANGQRLGYAVAESKVDVASIYNIPSVLHSLLRRIMARTDRGMQLTVWLRKSV